MLYKDYPVHREGQHLTTVRAYNPSEVKIKLSDLSRLPRTPS